MSLRKFLLKALSLYGNISLVLVGGLLVMVCLYPFYELYDQGKMQRACMAEHKVERCKIVQMAVPDV